MKQNRKTREAPSQGGASSTLKALTLRLDADKFHYLQTLARTENRTPTNYVETLVLRDLQAKSEQDRVITMFHAVDAAPGPLLRSEAESDERYAERSALFSDLLALPDAD